MRDICYATQNRQQAVRELAQAVDLILVVGSRNSSNSNRLREIGEELGKPAYLIDDAERAAAGMVRRTSNRSGVTAGASAPEIAGAAACWRGCAGFGEIEVSTLDGVAEDVRFRFPAEVGRRIKDYCQHVRAVEPGDPRRRLCRQAASARAASAIRWC